MYSEGVAHTKKCVSLRRVAKHSATAEQSSRFLALAGCAEREGTQTNGMKLYLLLVPTSYVVFVFFASHLFPESIYGGCMYFEVALG